MRELMYDTELLERKMAALTLIASAAAWHSTIFIGRAGDSQIMFFVIGGGIQFLFVLYAVIWQPRRGRYWQEYCPAAAIVLIIYPFVLSSETLYYNQLALPTRTWIWAEIFPALACLGAVIWILNAIRE